MSFIPDDSPTNAVEESSIPSQVGIAENIDVGGLTLLDPEPYYSGNSKAKPIKQLKVKHRRMIALYLQGYTYAEIASALGLKSSATVGVVITNPTTRGLLDEAFREHDDHLRALVPLARDAIRDGLKDPDAKTRLGAVDRLFRAVGKYRDNPDDHMGAEDVVKRIIQVRHGDAEVTIAEERR